MPPKQRPARKPQHQSQQPGRESEMSPRPKVVLPEYRGSGKLAGKVALITGGDSGIGRAVAVLYAKEGANVAIAFLNEQRDADETKRLVERENQNCFLLKGDIGEEKTCQRMVQQTVRQFGRFDILVNNAAEQHPQEDIRKITKQQLVRTFQTNIFAQFFLCKAAFPHLKRGASIINTTSVTAYRGSPNLLDYASTKGAIVAFTRSLSKALAKQGIRVNAVAPGPIWTPLIPSTFKPGKVAKFGSDVPLGRAGEPMEVAPCYVFLASTESNYMTGQVMHPNGGEIVNG